MSIVITLDKEEFEYLLIGLLNKALNREVTPEEIKSIRFDHMEGTVTKMIATIEPSSKPST